MRILMCQINPIVADLKGNVSKIISCLQRAREQHTDLVIFPELAITGYPLGDILLKSDFPRQIEEALQEVVEASHSLNVILGLPRYRYETWGKPYFNSAVLIQNGTVTGYQDKRLLPNYDVFDEMRFFQPGPDTKIFLIQNKKVAITICEDIWASLPYQGREGYRTDPISIISQDEIDLLINISASPFNVGKIATRTQLAQDIARSLQVPCIICNQVGAQDGLIFDGSSVVVNADGSLHYLAKSFEEEIVEVNLNHSESVAHSMRSDIEDVFSALCLGVKDYFHKQGFAKACLGVSGGIDSAVVACITVEALGADNVQALAMPSRYSSVSSFKDAKELCDSLGVSLKQIPIEKPFQVFLEALESAFSTSQFGIAEENLQSRIRGILLMATSNLKGSLVLNTGNKSELAVGYTTLYGDSCGAISVIGDVLKTQVYELARFINHRKKVIPQSIIDKEPSAELRPNQKDSDSLPPYETLDLIVKEYIEKQHSANEIASQYNLSKQLVDDLIKKIHQSEYKRRQAPFVLRISERAFGNGRNYPIVHKLED